LNTVALLITALLFGGMTLFSFAFAAFLFTALPVDQARTTIRKAFPHFYLFVIVTALAATAFLAGRDPVASATLVFVAITTVLARQVLMPAINHATDDKNKKRFNFLHGLSVVITLIHILATSYVLARFV
jgi:Domain of unknown function (DUF4149)